MKKKSYKQIKKLLIGMTVLVVCVLIFLIIFLSNVDIKGINELQNDEKNEIPEQNVIPIDNELLSEYSIVVNDYDKTFQIRMCDGKIYFSILDDNKFKEKYPESEVDTSEEIEIATHGYEINSIFVGTSKKTEYLIVLMKDGTLGIMNVPEAVKNNVFRIKNKLISINNTKVVNANNGYKENNNKQEKIIIIETNNGEKYDLADFVE